VLLAGLFAYGITDVIETVATRDHTERMLRAFGVASEGKTVSGDAVLTGCEINVPGDISSAVFFMVAAACLPGSDVRLLGVGVNPTRAELIEVLTDLGADLDVAPDDRENAEPSADITIKGGLRPDGRALIDGEVVAQTIDEIPALAVLGTQLPDGLEVRGAGELRVKESDRILAVVENLRAMGADVTEFDDGFRVERSQLKGAAIDSRGDHRIAMAFAVAGLLAGGSTEISNADAASVSYPAFFEDLEALAVR
jgi:3-phosphoshikimate 1-carboxyvinyltransferase